MFLSLDQKRADSLAVTDSLGHTVTYGALNKFIDQFSMPIAARSLIFILCENAAGACVGYAAAIANGVVPLMLSHTLTHDAVDDLIDVYHPAYLWMPKALAAHYQLEESFSAYGYVLLKTGYAPYSISPELALLLPTSGSTGSPKLVRHTVRNIEANARAVAQAFSLDEASRGMVSLPISFTQGLNVATSHLYAGGTVLLSTASLTQREFWSFLREQRADSFTGVPYSYELINRLRFFKMDLPDLKTINQGGGRMPDDLFQTCARYAVETGRRFIATYGSTETTSRMSFLPAQLAVTKTGSIGIPLPGCGFTLLDEEDREITAPFTDGEILFHGPNVTMGYAQCQADLLRGDERNGVYRTGDLAHFDEDGCYYIVGRKKRFLKLFGYRVSLDATERLIQSNLGISCACVGTDKRMCVYVTEQGRDDAVIQMLSEALGLLRQAFEVRYIEKLPQNDAGKILYAKLQV